MSEYSKEEIALILQAAEILKKKESRQKLNISEFCQEADISRKNAYKHKKKFDFSQHTRDQQIQQLQEIVTQLQEKLKSAELAAEDAELYRELRNILVALNDDYKKNGPGRTLKRLKLIESYNNVSSSLGLELLNCWE